VTTCSARIDSNGATAVLHRTVLASLPNRYVLSDGAAEVVLVSAGLGTDVGRVCGDGARAVFVDRPGRLSSEELGAIVEAADRNECIVVPAPRFAPRIAALEPFAGGDVDVLECTINGRDEFRSLLVEQLALVRTVLGAVASVRVLHSSATHYVVDATMADEQPVHVILNGLASPGGVDEVRLHAVGAERRLDVHIDAGSVARPARIDRFDRHGRHTPWPVHQHAHRITLTGLHRLLTAGECNLPYGPDELRHDVQCAAVLTN
jgi:hypothetical protein